MHLEKRKSSRDREIVILAVLSMILYYGVAMDTDFARTDRLWRFESSEKNPCLGAFDYNDCVLV